MAPPGPDPSLAELGAAEDIMLRVPAAAMRRSLNSRCKHNEPRQVSHLQKQIPPFLKQRDEIAAEAARPAPQFSRPNPSVPRWQGLRSDYWLAFR